MDILNDVHFDLIRHIDQEDALKNDRGRMAPSLDSSHAAQAEGGRYNGR